MMMRRAGIMIALLLVVAIPLSAEEVKVKTSGGTQKIDAVGDGESTYYSLSGLRDVIGGNLRWIRPGYSIRYTLETNQFRFTVGSPYINLNDSVYNLIMPVKLIRGELFVPAETFTNILNLTSPDVISWDPGGKALRIDAEWYNITDLNIAAKQNGVLIEIFMTTPLRYEIYESEGNWLNIDFPEGKINRQKIQSGINTRYIRKINAYQFDKSAQLSFRLRRRYKKYYTTFKNDPGRLQIAIEDSDFVPDSSLTGLNRIGPDEKIDVIVIDPGHGGRDFGAIGRYKKTREKDINLEIANELAKLIRKEKQFKVIMTRNKDKYVSLDDRAKIANDAHADLFISIHCNSSPKKSANGFQVFYLAPAKSDAARAVAQFENAPFLLDDPLVNRDEDNDLTFILNDMIQTEFLTESADLAYMADMEMRKNIKIDSRGVDHAGFVVLNRVYMPSILVESAFISNKNEEKDLRNKGFRKKVAEAIYKAVKRFKAKYERI
jgi:N-acetylmuramoyl-L-alanine amidase